MPRPRLALARGLALATALAFATAPPASAQGLREDARALLAEVDAGFTSPCQARERLAALLAELERAQAEPYMEAEVRDLRALQARIAEGCPGDTAADGGQGGPDAGPGGGDTSPTGPDAGPGSPDAGPASLDAGPDVAPDLPPPPDLTPPSETLVEFCDRLMREEAWCEVLATCAPLSDIDGRYKTLMSRAARGCPFF